MWTFFAIISLACPSIFFGIMYYVKYEWSFELNSEYWTYSKIIAVILLLAHFLWVTSVGAESVLKSHYFVSLHDFGVAFLLPGLAFALILFPETASELFGNHFELLKADLHKAAALIFGWTLLFISIFWFVLFIRLKDL